MTTSINISDEILDMIGSQFNEMMKTPELPPSGVAQVQRNMKEADKNKEKDVKRTKRKANSELKKSAKKIKTKHDKGKSNVAEPKKECSKKKNTEKKPKKKGEKTI